MQWNFAKKMGFKVVFKRCMIVEERVKDSFDKSDNRSKTSEMYTTSVMRA